MNFAAPRMPEPGDVLLGRFRVESVIGQGGMGLVFGARQLPSETPVAIKVLSPEASTHPEAVPRFINEARATMKLQSAHVVKVFEAGTLDIGLPFIVMELLQGIDLGALVEKQGALPVTTAIDYVIQAADAVAEAHALGIVHRDLKPSNLFLVQRPGSAPLVKVLDFGISKISNGPQNQALTATGTFLGSPHYMPPEQLKSARDVDAGADIWSLGIILYELLAGRPPFDGGSFGELFLKVLTGEFTPLRTVRPDVPEGVEQVVVRCLRRQRDERFRDLVELAQALAPFASPDGAQAAQRVGRPQPAPPPAAVAQAPRRNPLASTALLHDRPAHPVPSANAAPPARQSSPSFAAQTTRPSSPNVAAPPARQSSPSFAAQTAPRSAAPHPPSHAYGMPGVRSSGDVPAFPQSSPALPSSYVAQQAPQPPGSNTNLGHANGTAPKARLVVGVAIGALVVGVVGIVLLAVVLRARGQSPTKHVPAISSSSFTTPSAAPR